VPVLVVVTVAEGGLQSRTGLGDAPATDRPGRGIEVPVVVGATGVDIRLGEEVQLCFHGLSMKRGCDRNSLPDLSGTSPRRAS
jgi:hypothetical protein